MKLLQLRTRLLAGAALGLGASVIAPQQAMAACTVTANSVTCATTTTTDTTNAGATPAVDRNYPVNTSTGNFTGTVNAGATVDGFGLAFTNTVGGTGDLIIVNDGTIQINAGNTASAGGSAALNVTAIGATDVNYSGSGDILNLGTTGSGLLIDATGTGGVTANVGGSVTSAAGGFSTGEGILVRHSGTAGDIAVTTTAGETIGADWVGVFLYSPNAAYTGSMTLTNNAAVGSRTGALGTLDYGLYAQNTGTGAVTVANNGAIGSATDRILSIGIGADILNAGSTAALSVTGTGAVFSAGTGISATNMGTGTTTVNYTGAVNTTGGTGVAVSATTGATNVTLGAVTAATDAVVVDSTGAQTIALNGVTTGTAGSGLISNTTGARTITVGAAGNVTGGTQAILLNGTGTATVNNGGIIGAASTDLAINAAAAGATTINNQAAGTINGRVTLGTGADTFTNSGIFNTQGTNDFGAAADTLANAASGTINLTGATTLANLETFTNAGRINLNTFTLTGPAIAFNNTGTIDTSGSAGLAGFTSFSNAGTLDLAAGTFTVPAAAFTNSGTILADEGAATITGQTSFANTGTIDLQDAAVGDVLTINSSFAGSGASNLMVDFNETTADRLVITGAASGTTAVHANHVGAGLIDLDGVLVVDTASSSANAFVLGNVTGNVSPLIDYSLVQSGSDYFLLSTPNASAFDPLSLPVLAGTLWYQSADEVIAQTRLPAETVGLSYWGQVYGGRDKYGDDNDDQVIDGTTFDVDNELKTNRLGVQAGVDYGFGGGRVGVTAGWAQAKADGDGDLELKAKGWNIGLYGQFGDAIGFHGEVLAKYDRYDVDFDDGIFDGVSSDARSTGIDGALGYRFPLGGEATLDANVGLSHVWTKVDDIDAFGFEYDIDNLKSTRGRAGVRATFAGSLAPYVDATVYHEFSGDGDVDLFDGATIRELDTNGKNTYVRFEGGIAGRPTGPLLSAWADLGDRKGFGLRAGFRFGGAVVAEPVLAPPPPPPTEVAPATQTCPDGSVILATSTCAPPPPPPPPPPPVERGERG